MIRTTSWLVTAPAISVACVGLLLASSIAAAGDGRLVQRHHVVNQSDDASHAYENDPAFKTPNWDNVPSVALSTFSNPAAGWRLTPDGLPRQKEIFDIELKVRDATSHQRPEQIFIARQAPYAFVSYSREGTPAANRVELVTLSTGTSTGSFLLPPNSKVEDVSPDGASVLVHGEDQRGRLEIWTVDAQRTGAARTLLTFPYTGDDSGKEVDWACYTDSGHVAILNFGSKLAVFDTVTAKVVWMAMVEGGYRPKISPGGKYALVRTRDAAYKYREPTVIECATGKPIGMLDPGPVSDDPPLSFHSVSAWTPSGSRVAMMDDHNVRVWDMAAGQPVDLFGLPVGSKVWGGPPFAFTSEGTALLSVDGQTLIDFARRIPLWQYEPLHDSIVKVAADGRCWYTLWDVEAGKFFLIGAELPDAKAMARARELDPLSLLLLRPNCKVSVKVDVPGPDDVQKHIQEQLLKKLAARNITVADGQDVVVKALIEVGEPQHAIYSRIGRPPNEGRHVTYTMKTSKIVVEFAGNVAWQTFRFDEPGKRVDLEPGETIERAIARVSRPDYAFFDRAEIPAYVAKPHTPMCYGNSTLAPGNEPAVGNAPPPAPQTVRNGTPLPAPIPALAPPPAITPPAMEKPAVVPPAVSGPVPSALPPPQVPRPVTPPAVSTPAHPPVIETPAAPGENGENIVSKMRLVGGRSDPAPGEDGIVLQRGRLISPEEITAPFRLDVQAMTDSTNIRIRYARGEIIFNWEMGQAELRHQDPMTGHITGLKDKGKIPVNELVHITWIVTDDSSRVLVNGEERALISGDYKACRGKITVYAHGSKVTVKSVTITPLVK